MPEWPAETIFRVLAFFRLSGSYRLDLDVYAVIWLGISSIMIGRCLTCLHRCHQWADADNIDDALDIISQHMQGHFRTNPF